MPDIRERYFEGIEPVEYVRCEKTVEMFGKRNILGAGPTVI